MMGLVVTSLVAGMVGAGPDFAAESEQWNGTSYLEVTAREAKVTLTRPRVFDWSAMNPSRVLLVLGGETLRPDALATFVEDGGLVILALDGGRGADLLKPFGLAVDDRPVVHDAYFRDHPAFPQLTAPEPSASGEEPHFLWYNVRSLVLNHPVALAMDEVRRAADITPIIGFAEPGQYFAVETRHGAGYLLVLSDASVFINDMQRHAYGDKQFAANAMRYYCEKEDCDVVVVDPQTPTTGTYEPENRKGLKGLEYVMGRGIDALNRLALETSDWLGRPMVMWLWLLLVLVLLAASALALPWPRAVPRFSWESPPAYRPDQVDYWVSALSTSRATADFSLASAALADRVRRELRGRLSVPWPEDDDAIVRWLDAVTARRGDPDGGATELRALALRVVGTLNKVRDARPNGAGSARHVNVSEFEALWTDCETLLKAIPKTPAPATRR